jgi:hypothetical protein
MFMATTIMAEAQTKQAGQNKQRKTQTTAQQRGTGQYYGSRDTTPGSPMGTGGAGGGEMAGFPAGSPIETKDQTEKAKVQPNNQNGAQQNSSKPRKGTPGKKQ